MDSTRRRSGSDPERRKARTKRPAARTRRGDPAGSVEQLVDAATLIFKGTLKDFGISNLPEVNADEHVAVVTVDRVFVSPPVLGDLRGRVLTIRLSTKEHHTVGDEGIFFTNPWIYASAVAIAEVGWIETSKERDVASAIETAEDRKLAGLLDDSELVVHGTVEKIDRPQEVVEPISFHSPGWRVATLRLEAVRKGKVPGAEKRLEILFASSRDVLWESAPKLEVGQEAVFLLRRGRSPRAPAKAFAAVEPSEVLPTRALPRIQKLMRGHEAREADGGGIRTNPVPRGAFLE